MRDYDKSCLATFPKLSEWSQDLYRRVYTKEIPLDTKFSASTINDHEMRWSLLKKIIIWLDDRMFIIESF
ncbi:putative ATPase [Bacillus sp. TS-2]|nr:putative ATPase [Bacillus sp. TS-2]